MSDLREAAVLVPIIGHTEPAFLFTQRSRHLAQHAGQASFPGGRVEPGDENLIATALRETAEEIGLSAGRIDVLGEMPPYLTLTGFHITPIVGWVTPGFELKLDPVEVERVFEVPVPFALDDKNLRRQSAMYQGRRRHYHVLRHADNVVWGATAGILNQLREILLT